MRDLNVDEVAAKRGELEARIGELQMELAELKRRCTHRYPDGADATFSVTVSRELFCRTCVSRERFCRTCGSQFD